MTQGNNTGSAQRTDFDLLRAAVESLPIAVTVLDAESRTVTQSRLAAELTGNAKTDALLRASIEKMVAASHSGGVSTETVELRSGGARTFRTSATPMPGGGTTVILEDVSERRRLDTMRRDFVANVSHELRTPVGAIGLLLDTLIEEKDPDVVKLLQGHIAAEAARAKHLVEELLVLSRLEGELVRATESVSISDIVEVATMRARPTAVQRSIEIHSISTTSAFVAGDHEQLLSAVVNLLENAIKYSEPNSVVDVATYERRGVGYISVADRGIGISALDIERIFERFYRVDQARSRNTGGAGLGLAIVRHVVENHGGKVSAVSSEGEGSTFTIELPLAKP